MIPVNYIIHGDYVVTMNDKMEIIKNGAIALREETIVEVGPAEKILSKYKALTVIDKTGHIIMPGLINTHTHAPMVYFRGMADDMPLQPWLHEHIWPAEQKVLSTEFVYDGTRLACLEMLLGGTTTFADMYFFEGTVAKAVKEMRMRGVLAPTIFDFPTVVAGDLDGYLHDSEQYICEWIYDELITPSVSVHSPYACGDAKFLQGAQKLAQKYDVPMQIHIAETKWEEETVIKRYGMRPVEYLDSVGFLYNKIIGSHCVWVSDKEIDMLAKHGVGVAHCIESNLKMAAGMAPIVKMMKAGINVGLGTDSACSNNDLDMFSELATAAKVHKFMENDPTVMDAKTAVYLATRGGAKILGMSDKIGCLQSGYLADIITVSLNKPHSVPLYDVYSHLAYALRSSDVDSVIINGRVVVDSGKLIFVREEEIFAAVHEWVDKINSK